MKITKKVLSMILAFVVVLGLLPATALATEAEEYVYLSISFDGKYIDDKNGELIAYLPVPLDTIAAVDLTQYGLDNMLFDGDEDGNYDTTALQLLIYAHEEIYGGDWSDVNFDALPGSSYFAGGIFGFTENLVYFHNGDFPVDESQTSDYMTVGATSDRIVLKAGDFLDVASFSCYSFLWDEAGGFHMFADSEGNYAHDYTAMKGEALSAKLMHSFCDLMFGQSWVKEATDYEVYYGTTLGQAEGSVVTDDSGCVEVTFDTAGTYYLWCDGAAGASDHSACDYYYATGENCIVSAPAYAKVTVVGEEEPELPTITLNYPTLTFEDVITMNVYYQITDLENVAQMGLITYSDSVTDWDISTAEHVIPGYQWNEDAQLYVVSTEGIAAKNMSDTVNFAVYAQLTDGTYVYSELVSYNPMDYAYSQLKTGNDAMKKLVVSMLNYGASAQTYFNHRTDTLMNADLTAEQQALVEDYRSDMMSAVASSDGTKTASFTRTADFGKCYPSITFGGAFCINYYCTPGFTPDGEVTMYYWDQKAYDDAEVLSIDNASGAVSMTAGDGCYEAAVNGIAAKDLDKGIYVAFVYTNGENSYCSGVLGYSIGAYCVSQAAGTSRLAPFAAATAVYGYYAKNLFYS